MAAAVSPQLATDGTGNGGNGGGGGHGDSSGTISRTSVVLRLDEKDGGSQRFLVELEFVQSLANPNYIHYLAQNGFFDDPAFVNYLKYLQYWRKPPYIQYIMYPHSLFFLELLQSPNFRAAMAHPQNKELVHRQQFQFWMHYRNNRLRQLEAQQITQGADDGGAAASAEPSAGGADTPAEAAAAMEGAVTAGAARHNSTVAAAGAVGTGAIRSFGRGAEPAPASAAGKAINGRRGQEGAAGRQHGGGTAAAVAAATADAGAGAAAVGVSEGSVRKAGVDGPRAPAAADTSKTAASTAAAAAARKRRLDQ